MRRALIALGGAVVLTLMAACGEREPYPYPAAARAHFESTCRPDDPVCVCTWDRITRTVPYDEYEAALARFREQGAMDPRITRVRVSCIEENRER
jgi:hypothetical protein